MTASFRRFTVMLGLAVLAPTLSISAQDEKSGGRTVQPLCSGCGGGTTDTISVTPDGTAGPNRATNASGFSARFAVKNLGHTTPTVSLTCSSTGGIICGTVSPTSLVSMDFNELDSVTVNYSTGNTAGAATLVLTGNSAAGGDTGYYSITVVAQPPTIAIVVPVGSPRAIVHNRQPVVRATFLPASGGSVDTTKLAVTWRGDTVTVLGRHNRGLFEWEVDSTRWLTTGATTDSAQLIVRACDTDGGCATSSRWVVLPNDSTPVLGFTGMPLENLGGGFSAPFGKGIAVSGGEVETGFSVPSYVSMGMSRSAGLVYSTRQSYPRALVNVDLDLPWPATTPTQVKLILSDSIAHRDSLTLTGGAASCLTGSVRRCRATLEADFSGATYTTPTRKWLRIEAQVTSGATMKSSVDSVEVVVVDRRATNYGSGWWPAGISQLVQAGSDRVVVGATGTAVVYRGNGDSTYIPSPGNFTALVKTASGWELRPRGSSAKTVFNASGQLLKSVDQNGNRDSVHYRVTGEVDTLFDPVGKLLRLGYDGNGKISAITDPGGRVSAIRVNNTTNLLVYDSLAAPGTRHDTTAYRYQAYPGTKTAALYGRVGVLTGDSTHVVYDSTFRRRPVQVVLPAVQDETGATVTPTITYGAYERRGYGALASLDSVYVEMKDPRNNWTRSLLNRWGESRKTWDALGTLGLSTYSPEGHVLTSEGKNGDSSRVYHDYDAARRLVRSYLCRGSCSGASLLRTDSLIYDANHRVTRRIDARGQATTVAYDASGNAIRMISPNNDTTIVGYRADGLVDSTRAPGNATATHLTYEATWKNAERVVDPNGDTLTINSYDTYGRLIQADHKLRVHLTSSTDTLQWRRIATFYGDANNQVDSVRTMVSPRCRGTGCSAPLFPNASDTTRTQRVGYRYDQAGRDTARVNDRGKASVVHYDLLGRVRASYPYADSTAVVDSSYYDIAGNPKQVVTRRGSTITSYFDSRNRDTLSVIPGVGNRKKTYGGPLDQLTRIWDDTPVDSIGGVNRELRFGYDARGRLTADTSYTGTIARATTHVYDQYERDSLTTDPLGAWRLRYEAARGYPVALLTPFGDSIAYNYDRQSRPVGPDIWSSGTHRQQGADHWLVNGTLDTLGTTAYAAGTAFNPGTWARPAATSGDAGELPLAPQWTQQLGVSQSIQTLTDSVSYDAWGRLIQWKLVQDGTQTDSVAYSFDRAGNISQTATPVYDVATDRLTSRGAGGTADSLSYDRAGNLTRWRTSAGTVWTYGYDALEQMISVRSNGTLIARYGYDVEGRRITKRVYSTSTGGTLGYLRLVYHGGQVAIETDSSGTMGLAYTYGLGTDQLYAVHDSATSAHYYTTLDKLGSIRAITQRDGTWLLTQRFSPYADATVRDTAAAALIAPRLRYRWTGREYDTETGLYYLRARYYSPALRRFVAADPIGTGGGSNVYAYVGGNPLEATDPSGMAPAFGGGTGAGNFAAALHLDKWWGNQSDWDGWFGISGTLLPRKITYYTHPDGRRETIDAPIDEVQKYLDAANRQAGIAGQIVVGLSGLGGSTQGEDRAAQLARMEDAAIALLSVVGTDHLTVAEIAKGSSGSLGGVDWHATRSTSVVLGVQGTSVILELRGGLRLANLSYHGFVPVLVHGVMDFSNGDFSAAGGITRTLGFGGFSVAGNYIAGGLNWHAGIFGGTRTF